MFNHDSKLPVSWEYNLTTGYFEVKAARMYYAGEQVYLSYGNKSNLNLLLWYGFVADVEQTKYYFQISPQAKSDIRHQLMSKLDSSIW